MKTTLVNLKGGAKLLFNRQTEVNGISVYFYFNAGAMNDPAGKLGVAHFVEHALFSFPNDKMTRQQRFDAMHSFQFCNASTNAKEIKFVVNTIDNKLEEAFDYITEPFNSAKITHEEFEIEQKIIRDEIETNKKLNRMQNYILYCTEILNNEKTKNIVSSVAGTLETFNKITMEDLQDFIKDYMTLNNLTIVVVGNTKLSKLKKLIKKYVEPRIKISDKEGYVLKNPQLNAPNLFFAKAVEKDKARIHFDYALKPLPFRYEPYREVYIANFLTDVINELTFNFYRIEKNLCYSCSAMVYNSDDWLTHSVLIPCAEKSLQEVIDVYEEYINSFPADLPRELFDKHKEKTLNSFDFDFPTLDKISTSCISCYERKRKLFDTKTRLENREMFKSITYEETNELYKTLFKVKPHISIVSNDEKYKDYKYEDFKVIKN